MNQVTIVGGGIAGLTCANFLEQAGLDCTILEATETLGGRIQTDRHEGFLLDRGFQVLLTSYPEARRVIDFKKLNLSNFQPGALIWTGTNFHKVSDPTHHIMGLPGTLMSPVGYFSDKLRIAKLKLELAVKSGEHLLNDRETQEISAERWLRNYGFSDLFMQRFLRPFFGGVFLDYELTTCSSFFRYMFKMFSEGHAALPELGMGEIIQQLASQLSRTEIRLRSPVVKVTDREVELSNGEKIQSETVVIALDRENACQLVGKHLSPLSWKSISTLYFRSKETPVSEPILVLNGSGAGLINTVAVLDQVSASYAPPNEHLISVSTIGIPFDSESDLVPVIQNELSQWFGNSVWDWKKLHHYSIKNALPAYDPQSLFRKQLKGELPDWLYLCGDHMETPSLEGAIKSARKTAELILKQYRVFNEEPSEEIAA
jgi:phytoene dehydrogenase-like protein